MTPFTFEHSTLGYTFLGHFFAISENKWTFNSPFLKGTLFPVLCVTLHETVLMYCWKYFQQYIRTVESTSLRTDWDVYHKELKNVYDDTSICLHCTILTCFTVLMQASRNDFNNQSFLIKIFLKKRSLDDREILLWVKSELKMGVLKTLHSVPLNKGVPSGVLYPFYCPQYNHNNFPSFFMVCQVFIPSFPASRFPSFHFPLSHSSFSYHAYFHLPYFPFSSILVSSSSLHPFCYLF